MEERLTVMFTCMCCGNVTPAIARLPIGVDADRPVDLSVDCHHCDAPMKWHFPSVRALRKRAAQDAAA